MQVFTNSPCFSCENYRYLRIEDGTPPTCSLGHDVGTRCQDYELWTPVGEDLWEDYEE